jgi:hypothetical protein
VTDDEPETGTQESPNDVVSVELPRGLEEFLSGTCAPAAYFKQISKNRAKPPGEESRRTAAQMALDDPSVLTRVVDLVRAGSDERAEGRIRQAMMALGSEIVRLSAPELSEWGTIGTMSTDSEIGLLANRLRRARASKDKMVIVRAEAALLIGFIVCTTRADFNLVGALSALTANINDGKQQVSEAANNVKRTLRRASIKTLEMYGSVNAIVAAKLEESGRQLSDKVADNQSLRGRVRSLEDEVAVQRQKIAELEGEISHVSEELTDAQGHIAGVKGGAAHDMIEMKARARQFLARSVKPALKDAEDALQIEPPFVDVARERIGAVSSDVEKELAWLNQSPE